MAFWGDVSGIHATFVHKDAPEVVMLGSAVGACPAKDDQVEIDGTVYKVLKRRFVFTPGHMGKIRCEAMIALEDTA